MINITVYAYKNGAIKHIRVRGHSDDSSYGRRICSGVAVLCRTVMRITGTDKLETKALRFGAADIPIPNTKKEQDAAKFAIAGFEMLKSYAPEMIAVETVDAKPNRRSNT